MIWPNDLEMRKNYLVTAAALSKQKVRDAQLPEQVRQTVLQNVASKLQRELTEDERERIAVIAQINGAKAVSSILAEIDELYYEPQGGDGRLACAGGFNTILETAMNDGVRQGSACGEILWNIVTLDKHHPHLKASRNHAEHIMVRRAKYEGRTIPGETTRRTTMWRKYGPVAPLWAAYVFCKGAAREQGLPWAFNQWLKPVVSVSLWFANFAVNHKVPEAKSTLLSEAQVVRVNPELVPLEPHLPPFSSEELRRWARPPQV
jgi:hypothetical protein